MENIGWFVDFITAYGVQQEYIFVTVDLYEKQNVWGVGKLLEKTLGRSSKLLEKTLWRSSKLLEKHWDEVVNS